MRAALSYTPALAEETVMACAYHSRLYRIKDVPKVHTQTSKLHSDIHICRITRKNAAHFQISHSSSRRHPL
jgi:hypothetical protein